LEASLDSKDWDLASIIDPCEHLLSESLDDEFVLEEQSTYACILASRRVMLLVSYDWRDRLLQVLYATPQDFARMNETKEGWAWLSARDSLDSMDLLLKARGADRRLVNALFDLRDEAAAIHTVCQVFQAIVDLCADALRGEAFGMTKALKYENKGG
jgi:hypothetical protein